MPSIPDYLAALGDAATPFAVPAVSGLADAELLEGQRALAELRRRVDAIAAAFAGEIAHRSRRELGHAGLAQTNGLRSAEDLIATVTAGSRRAAHTLVKAAELLPAREREGVPSAPPAPRWRTAIGEAVASAVISVEAADLIRTRLGQASDELDLVGIAERERGLREKRFLRITRQLDGMTRVSGLLDPESAAIVVPILDAATSSRRGGPRFVDPEAVQRPDDIARDERTTEQLALDVFVELVRLGARVEPGTLLGDRTPAVRLLVTRADLEAPADADGNRAGAAFFEGHADAVSVATAERYICTSGAIPILFDSDGRVLNLGRVQQPLAHPTAAGRLPAGEARRARHPAPHTPALAQSRTRPPPGERIVIRAS